MSFKHELVSAYNEMLDIKVSLGFSRHNYTSHILPFIDFCTDKHPGASESKKDMLDQWLVSKSFNTDNTRRLAIINIRHFARYLNATGGVHRKRNFPGASTLFRIGRCAFTPHLHHWKSEP